MVNAVTKSMRIFLRSLLTKTGLTQSVKMIVNLISNLRKSMFNSMKPIEVDMISRQLSQILSLIPRKKPDLSVNSSSLKNSSWDRMVQEKRGLIFNKLKKLSR